MTKNKKPACVYVVPFSHLDLFWTGTREECLSRGNLIISKALELLEQHDDFRYLIETANFLDQYLDCYPKELERIKKLAISGRLELAPLWTGIYQNLPGGETLVRNVLYAKHYIKSKLGIDPIVAHFGDLPGYTPQFPQIAKLSGIKNILMSRGGPSSTPLFNWEALNGDKVISYFSWQGYAAYAMGCDWHKTYDNMLSETMHKFIADKLQKEPCGMIHWGSDLYAPIENIVHNVRKWNENQESKLQFSTLTEFFNVAEEGEGIPVLKGELPSAWPNVESSWPDIWAEDLPCEAALHMAEFLSSYCLMHGWLDYPQSQLEDAWKALLDGMDHNQNGQGGERADRDKLQLKLYSKYSAERIIDKMSWRLASRVPLLHCESAFPVVVFNSMSWQRDGIVSGHIAIFGKVRSCDIPEFSEGLSLVNDTGESIPYVVLSQNEGLSVTQEIAFRADVPSAGYRTYYIVPAKNPINDRKTCHIHLDSDIDKDATRISTFSTDCVVQAGPRRSQSLNTYENDFFKISIDSITGTLNVYDKILKKSLLEKIEIAGIEERRGNYISDMTPSGRTFPAIISNIETIDNNAVWCRIRITGSIYSMPFTQIITLYCEIPEISLENEIDWLEPRWVRLEQLFEYPEKGAEICYGIPFGYIKYPEILSGSTSHEWDEISQENRNKLRLCRHWVDIGNDTSGATIAADHRMWEFEDKRLRSYMLRGSGYCFGVRRNTSGELENISRPPAGKYRFRYTIKPRYRSLAEANSYRCGWELNHPCKLTAVSGTNGKSTMTASDSLVDFSNTSLVTTAIKKCEDSNSLLIRVFESAGKQTSILPEKLNFSLHQTDIMEQNIEEFSPQCKSFEIKTIIIDK